MILGRVVGKAVATVKHPSLKGMKMLVIEPIQAASLDPVLAIDEQGAGPGDLVVLSSDGLYTREVVNDDTSPARWVVMCIIDNTQRVLELTT
ncbi:MAG: ethanolamine utilization protein EutN [Phycisphaerales bacterium]|nr:ethanolamine utilization protein EutN [Phycisphaerales bacterium]